MSPPAASSADGASATAPDGCSTAAAAEQRSADPLTPQGRQHLAAALALRIPAFAVVAKADAGGGEGGSSARQLAAVRAALAAVAGRPGDVDAAAPLVASREQAQRLASRLASDLASSARPDAAACAAGAADAATSSSFGRLFPVFPVSCVTGHGLPQLHSFLAALPQSRPREGTSRCGSLAPEEGGERQPASAASVLGSGDAAGAAEPAADIGLRTAGAAGPAAAAGNNGDDSEQGNAAALGILPILQVEQVLEARATFVAAKATPNSVASPP